MAHGRCWRACGVQGCPGEPQVSPWAMHNLDGSLSISKQILNLDGHYTRVQFQSLRGEGVQPLSQFVRGYVKTGSHKTATVSFCVFLFE